jgi:hypothetical protein
MILSSSPSTASSSSGVRTPINRSSISYIGRNKGTAPFFLILSGQPHVLPERALVPLYTPFFLILSGQPHVLPERALVPLYTSMSGPQSHNSETGWGEVRNICPCWKPNIDFLKLKVSWWLHSSLLKTTILDFAHYESFDNNYVSEFSCTSVFRWRNQICWIPW